MISHHKLVDRLHTRLPSDVVCIAVARVTLSALRWLDWYQADRRQYVKNGYYNSVISPCTSRVQSNIWCLD